MQRIAALSEECYMQSGASIHHINDGANAPWQKYGERFFRQFPNLGEISLALISSANKISLYWHWPI